MKFLLIITTIIVITINANSTEIPTLNPLSSGDYIDKNYSISITIHECSNEFCVGLIVDDITQQTMMILDEHMEQMVVIKNTQINDNRIVFIATISMETYIELQMDGIAEHMQLELEREYDDVEVQIIKMNDDTDDSTDAEQENDKEVSVMKLLQKPSVQISISGVVIIIAALCIYFCLMDLCVKKKRKKKRAMTDQGNMRKETRGNTIDHVDQGTVRISHVVSSVASVSTSPRQDSMQQVELNEREPGSIANVAPPGGARMSTVTVQVIGARASDDFCDEASSDSESLRERRNAQVPRMRSSSDEMYYNDNDDENEAKTNGQGTTRKPMINAVRVAAGEGQIKVRHLRSDSDQMYFNDNSLQRINECDTADHHWD